MIHALDPVKSAVKAAVASTPGWRLASHTSQPGCVVLLYHRVGIAADEFPHLDVSEFQAQMEWLTRNCHVVAPEELRYRAVNPGSCSEKPNVLVTFDDGYRGYYDHAYPVLKRCGIRAINFLCTRFVDEGTLVSWWDRLYLAVVRTKRTHAALPWLDRSFALDSDGRQALLRAAKDYIKKQMERDKEGVTRAVIRALDVDESALRIPRQTMTWDEVRDAADFTSYGGHTHNHAIVSQLDSGALEAEIRMCRDRIADETDAPPDTFAYPNGGAGDFTEEAKDVLRAHGFETAFSAIDGINGADTDWMEVRRIPGGTSVADLAWRLSRAVLAQRHP